MTAKQDKQFFELVAKMTKEQREDCLALMKLMRDYPERSHVLDDRLAEGLRGPDALRVAIDAMRFPPEASSI